MTLGNFPASNKKTIVIFWMLLLIKSKSGSSHDACTGTHLP